MASYLPALAPPCLNPTPCPTPTLQEQNNLRTTVLELLAIRKRNNISCRSKATIRKAAGDVYAATIDDKVAMKMGHGDWSPRQSNLNLGQKEWKLVCSGPNFAVWEAVY
jgi:alpha-amylase